MTIFYAHYDADTGKIFSVAGRPLEDDHPGCSVVEMDEQTALRFLNHEWQLNDWIYGKQYGKELELVVVNAKGMIPINVGEFIEIHQTPIMGPGLIVSIALVDKLIEFSIPADFRGFRFGHIKGDTMAFTLTPKRDPSVIVAVFELNVDKFFETGYASFTHEFKLNDYSIYCERVFIYNSLEISKVPKTISKVVPTSRFNKLVTYKEQVITDGILATHDIKANTLTLEIIGKPVLHWPSSANCPIFLTMPKDPNVVYDALPIDVESLCSNKKITLQLPLDLNQAFGVASYPLSSDLAFIRKPHGKRKKTAN